MTKDYFMELLLKLSDLHNFYFDPELRIKDSIDRNDQVKIKKTIQQFYQTVRETIPSLQLYNSPDYEEDYSFLVPDINLENGWKQNKYFELYRFLQDENDLFIKFQKEDAQILWCLFAYVDVISPELPIKYLFGPANDINNKDLNPHFFFKAYHINSSDEFVLQPGKYLANMANAAFYSRKKAVSHKEVDFVWVLESNRKRTTFEIENNLMYIPSGEMDCCILQWIFLILDRANFHYTFRDVTEKIKLDLKEVVEILFDDDSSKKIKIPYVDKEKCLVEWLELWGLIEITGEVKSLEVTEFNILPRAKAMLHWFSIYLHSLNCDNKIKNAPHVFDTKGEPNYWRVLALKKMYDKEKEDHAYLKTKEPEILNLQREIVDALKNNTNIIGNDMYKKQFFNMIQIMLNWREKLPEHGDVSWKIFQNRCRFSTFIHFLQRFGEKEKTNLELGKAPTGLLAFPVQWDTVEDERYPVGFFMSIIKETNTDNESYFQDFDSIGNEFRMKISKIRSVIMLIAKVENMEVYQKAIRKHQEEYIHQIFTGSLMYSIGHFLKNRASPIVTAASNHIELLNLKESKTNLIKSAEKILLISKHIENIGNLIDILGRSVEKKESVFYNVPENKKNVWLSKSGQIDLLIIIKNLVKDYKIIDNTKEIKLSHDKIESLKIHSIFKGSTVLPADFFYEQILFELLYNAIKNSFIDSENKKQIISLNLGEKNGYLFIQNKCKPDVSLSSLILAGFPTNTPDKIYRDKYSKDLTGLVFIERIVKHTSTGHLNYFVEGNKDFATSNFYVFPNFEGLEIN